MTVLRCCVLVMAAIAASPAAAQKDFPNRPLRIILGFPPASSNDILARFLAQKFVERYGQQAIVDNRPGANGIIATELVARANPDGYTMLLITTTYTMNAALYKLPFDPHKAFIPVNLIGTGPLALVSNLSFPPKNVRELVELAKAKPGTLTYGTAGNGGINHFATEVFARAAGIQLIHVPYKGGAPALTDVIAGQINFMFGTLPLTVRQIQAGKIRGYAVSAGKRTPLLPDVPTLAEAGVPGAEVSTWWGIAVPAGTPDAIVAKLNADITAIVTQPEAAQRLESEGAEPRPLTSAAFSKFVASEMEKWARVAREANIRIQ
ncbi:MAG: tripartite tricarboxylate transporter substrate binding protein [Burkholderiales bacterium]